MRASTIVTILSLLAWAALSVALPLPAIKYAPLSCCICDAQVLSSFADLSPMSARYAGSRARATVSRAGTNTTLPRLTLAPGLSTCPNIAPRLTCLTPRPVISPRPIITPRPAITPRPTITPRLT